MNTLVRTAWILFGWCSAAGSFLFAFGRPDAALFNGIFAVVMLAFAVTLEKFEPLP